VELAFRDSRPHTVLPAGTLYEHLFAAYGSTCTGGGGAVTSFYYAPVSLEMRLTF
jgi:hypothetical protein